MNTKSSEAGKAGLFVSKAWGKKYSKIQLLTIANLLAGKQIDMPSTRPVDKAFKKAEKLKKDEGEQLEIKKDEEDK